MTKMSQAEYTKICMTVLSYSYDNESISAFKLLTFIIKLKIIQVET